MQDREAATPYPKNVEGPFYVENGCCTACGVPDVEAPELMAWDDGETTHCYFRRQPQTPNELYRALRAVRASEFDCLRYRGDDPDILRRIAELDMVHIADGPVLSDIAPVTRTHVTFSAGEPKMLVAQRDLLEIASSFSRYFEGTHSALTRYQPALLGVSQPEMQDTDTVVFTCTWTGRAIVHDLLVTRGETDTNRILIAHSRTLQPGSIALSIMLDDWLHSSEQFQDVRWYSKQIWSAGAIAWQDTPI